jgi:predicted esterase
VLPDGVRVGEHTRIPIPNDRAVHVYHAPAEQRRAVVYLHGVCGDINAVRSWIDRAVSFGTFIELVGDSPCEHHPGRYAWKAPVTSILDRVRVALRTVKAVRGGLLDTDQIVLFGYSQGAARAEAMAHDAPGLFTHVVLGSPPEEPDPQLLGACQSVVVLGGSEESTRHLEAGVAALVSAGVRARFVSLPGAAHGQYGPQAPAVVTDALGWLLGQAPNEPGSADGEGPTLPAPR